MLTIDKVKRAGLFHIHALKVNNAAAPLGIDDLSIRFSWQLMSEVRGIIRLDSGLDMELAAG